MSSPMTALIERLTSKKGIVFAIPVVLLIGALVGIGRQPAPALAADATKVTNTQVAQAGTPAAGTANDASPFSAEQKAAIEKIVKDYLLSNPEMMMEVQTALEAKMETLQAERLKAGLKDNADELFRRADAPTAGNASGDVTVVEFFDYNCGYCKRAFVDIARLVDGDPKVKVVFKELPILSKGSEEASRVALAAKLQGKYWEAHRVLIGVRGELNEQSSLKAVDKLGLDMPKLKKDMQSPEVTAEIETVRNLAQKLGIQGTPYFLVGDRSIPGAPQNLLEIINGHVAELRVTGCSTC